ncbi:MAG: hypothetical protein HFI60_19140 [Lachnospiraceae bacterium]|jgi:hypothetical protein|nr:hypothetical protein [Lachnospiraceae bacterium]
MADNSDIARMLSLFSANLMAEVEMHNLLSFVLLFHSPCGNIFPERG